jgi:hypothetical protein
MRVLPVALYIVAGLAAVGGVVVCVLAWPEAEATALGWIGSGVATAAFFAGLGRVVAVLEELLAGMKNLRLELIEARRVDPAHLHDARQPPRPDLYAQLDEELKKSGMPLR